MTADDAVKAGQENRQKCDQQDDVLLCLIDSGRDQSTPTQLQNPMKSCVSTLSVAQSGFTSLKSKEVSGHVGFRCGLHPEFPRVSCV